MTTGPTGLVSLVINNSNGGQIQAGGNITAMLGGDVTTNAVNLQIDNRFNSFIGNGAALTLNVTGALTTTSDASFTILNSQLGTTGGDIDSPASISATLTNTTIGRDLIAYIDNRDGEIGPTGDEGTVMLQINGTLGVTGRINVLGTLNSTGIINAGTLSATNVSAPEIQVGGGGITRFSFPDLFPINVLHTINTGILGSTGGINFNGQDLGTPPGFGPFDGGQLTINVPMLSFGSSAVDNIQGPVTFNGGNSSDPAIPAGNGGTFNVNTSGNITVNNPIEATTGFRPDATEPSGTGGTVNLNSIQGAININSAITVSSADAPAGVPRRRSAAGGNINLKSDTPTGVAINVSNTGQLLSLLDAAAPGPGGKVTILATGATSRVTVTGGPSHSIRADRGSIDIRHQGVSGLITLSDANMLADIVKVGALGDNGVLTIGGGVINANTVLKLYATGPNGSVVFVSNVLLTGNSMKIIAGNSVTVNNGVVVSVGPGGVGTTPADVYVLDPTKANYSTLNGGNNSTNGMFIIEGTGGPSPTSGAVTHLGVPPPAFGPPGGP